MPYDIRQSGSRYQVIVADTGRVVGTHATRADAVNQQQALYANVPEVRKSDDITVNESGGRDAANDVAGYAYSAPNGVTNVDTINRLKQIINGSNSNKKPKKKEKDEQPVKDTWQGQFFPRRM